MKQANLLPDTEILLKQDNDIVVFKWYVNIATAPGRR